MAYKKRRKFSLYYSDSTYLDLAEIGMKLESLGFDVSPIQRAVDEMRRMREDIVNLETMIEDSTKYPILLPEVEISNGCSGVYFLQAINGLIKIGYSTNVKGRIGHFRNTIPFDVQLVGVLPAPNSLILKEIEKRVHHDFMTIRFHNEWFYPSSRLVEFILGLPKANNGVPAQD